MRWACDDPTRCILDADAGAVGITITGGVVDVGAAVHCASSSPTFVNCILTENEIAEMDSKGGALFCWFCSPTFIDCRFEHNACTWSWCEGGAVGCRESSPISSGCTFTDNTAGDTGSGGAIYCAEATPVLANTIISFSTTGESIYIFGTDVPALTCCDLYGNEGGDWRWPLISQLDIEGNICADPCYCDAGLDDFQLWNYTPCNPEGCGQIVAWPNGC